MMDAIVLISFFKIVAFKKHNPGSRLYPLLGAQYLLSERN